jgi:hypothetical protein
MLQEAIRLKIEALLNENTKSVNFVVGQYAKKDDIKGDYIYNIKNGYKLLSKTYVPSMMVFNCDYTPVPLTKSGYASVSLDFLLPTSNDTVDDDFNDKKDALDETVAKIVGVHYEIVDGATTYHSQWSMTAFTNPVPLEVANGIYFVKISTTIFIDFSDTFRYSNEWEWYLNNTRIYPLLAKRSRNAEQENPHILGTAEAVTENASNAWSCLQSFYVNDYLSALLDVLNGVGYSQETVYELGVVSPTKTSGTAASIIAPKAQVNGVDVWSVVSNGTTQTLFKLDLDYYIKALKTLASVTGTYSELLKTYAALLANDTEGVAFDYTSNAIYLKIATSTVGTVSALYAYLNTNEMGFIGTYDGIYKSVIIKEHTDPQSLGEKAEVTFTFVLSNTPYSG